MSKSLNDLLAKSKAKQEQTQEAPKKSNPFEALKKKTSAPAKKISFGTKKKETPVSSQPPVEGVSEGDALAPQSTASPSLYSDPAIDKKVAEIQKATEFVSEDQPDQFPPEALEKLKNSMEVLEQSFDQPELVGEAVKSLMLTLHQNENLKDVLAPEDWGKMVRGLRESYGTTIAKKSARTGKRAQNAAEVDDVMNLLSTTGFSIG